MHKLPKWIFNLENDDLKFIKNFICCSGSLKEISQIYESSYPTIRLRLDRIIQKIKLSDSAVDDEFEKLIKNYAIEGDIDYRIAKDLLNAYRAKKESECDAI